MKIPHYTKIHNRFQLNSYTMNREELLSVAYSFVKEGDPFEQEMGDFLLYWLDENPFIEVQTSGATGLPKKIVVSKQAMVHSALLTGEYFGLQPGHRALHCLPSNFIAGKMMLVRAMILGLSLDLIAPTTTPQLPYKANYDFAAMIPIQAQYCFPQLDHIATLIIGGAPLPIALRKQLAAKKHRVYETYGMTETLSHVAVRPVTDPPEAFSTLPTVSVFANDDDCLGIKAPHISDTPIITKDIVVCYSDQKFTYLGRQDFMINSGGRKLYPEQIEQKLTPLFKTPFFIHKLQDATYGEIPILIIEGTSSAVTIEEIKKAAVLEKWELPKKIICITSFSTTSSGKVKRNATAAAALT